MSLSVPVPVTGMGCVCAAGNNLEQTLSAMYRGYRYPRPPQKFSGDHLFPVFEVVTDFFPANRISTRQALRTGNLALTAVIEALDDAGLDAALLASARVGVCIGTNVGSSLSHEAFYQNSIEGCDPYISPQTKFLLSNPASLIAREFDCDGPCQTVVNACSAGTDALGLATALINQGLCDIVIAGGADELYQVTYLGFISLMISDNEPCRPFDRHRKGLNLGEGAGIMILESESFRQQRGQRARAFIAGYGSSCDGYHLTAPRPDGKCLKAAMRQALNYAGIETKHIGFINTHGTGTKDNDRIESRLIYEIFPPVFFLSSKGFTGHMLGAAGAVEAVLTAAFLEQGRIPASIGFEEPDPDLPVSPVNCNTDIKAEFALTNTLAFGGNNAVLVIKRGEK